MALSNGNTFSGDLIFLNPRSKTKEGEKCAPHFEIAKAAPAQPGEKSKIVPTGETATKVSGDMLRPRFTTREYEGKESKHATFYIRDGEETYSLDLTYRISSRALFNAILSLTDPKAVEISIYESKKGYEALSLWQAGAMVPWKFDSRKGEIPEAEVIKDKKGNVVKTDFSEIDEFFEKELKEWATRIFGAEQAKNDTKSEQAAPAPKSAPVENKPAAATPAAKPATPPPAENLDSEIPF